ncbi:LytTR family DNA-binding domain-containing protein [Aquimarina sp. 2201CG5-10]|uniref:LytR/AlgR family response regulator transcription factor n=1 Tax=Aquimarina callyspongiae TaxID=3098150 RepID=UPI002AB34FDF|nr:LytTR family DNA-binding domain-containing protein [Aquimarina sp. 2201CG5-10]MDY8136929.1 LytTR family DNA-binding domain-containing protein [Aquimarina sp. 2201CG5-10]
MVKIYTEKLVSVVVIEDEKEAFENLSNVLIKNFKEIEVIGNSDNVQDSIELLNCAKPELVFMDIELVDGNAFQILDKIENYDFEIIFTTAHNNYLEKAISYYAFHFLTKPLEVDKLKKVVTRYLDLKNRLFTQQKYKLLMEFINESRLLVQVGNEHIAIDLNDIVKCEADGNYTHFLTTGKVRYLASKPLKYYEKLLIERGFFRANRFVLINIKHIRSIYKKEAIVLANNEKIVVSVRNKSKLSELIKYLS